MHADHLLWVGRQAVPRRLANPERADRRPRPGDARSFPGARYGADAGAGIGGRRIAPRHDRTRPARHGNRLHVNGRNLDDPALEPVWATAAELGAFILVHPLNAAGVPRLEAYYLKNLIGNPLDTTVAAASLVFGGVLERHPTLTFCMVHGGGFAPYQAARWTHGWEVAAGAEGAPQDPRRRPRSTGCSMTRCCTIRGRSVSGRSGGARPRLLGSDYPSIWGNTTSTSSRRSKSHPAIKRACFAATRCASLGDAMASKAGIGA